MFTEKHQQTDLLYSETEKTIPDYIDWHVLATLQEMLKAYHEKGNKSASYTNALIKFQQLLHTHRSEIMHTDHKTPQQDKASKTPETERKWSIWSFSLASWLIPPSTL